MSRILALDVGKSGCRAACYVDGTRVTQGEAPGPTILAGARSARASLHAAQTAAATLGIEKVDMVAAGVAGLGSVPEIVPELAEGLSRQHGAQQAVLAGDMTTSHLGALHGTAGVVIAAGTGAVALAIADDGTNSTSDGWGFLLGDAGSGYHIGRQGLDAALRAQDGRGGSETLRLRAQQRFGDLRRLPSIIHGADSPARMIASFTPDVANAAQQGDQWCRSVFAAAGVELANSTATAAQAVFSAHETVPTSTTGGLFDIGPLLGEPFEEALARSHSRCQLRPRAGDALAGAYLMATRTELPHEHLLIRT